MIHKSIFEILDTATDDQVREWWKEVNEGAGWPASMPIPSEAFEGIWHPLSKKFISLPYKEEKKDVKV